MADENNPEGVNPAEQNPDIEVSNDEAAAHAGQGPQFVVQKLYVKDVSFEVPNAPEIFQEGGNAEVKLNLAQRVENIGENLHEVVLTVTVTATMEEKTAYLAEVAQAGIFTISGFNEQAHHAALNTLCPNTLFPYARQEVSNLVTNGGFPPMLLQPINWDALYAQRLQEAQAQAGDQVAEGQA